MKDKISKEEIEKLRKLRAEKATDKSKVNK